MSSFLPEGFRLRRGSAADAAAVTELTVAEESAVRGSAAWTETDTNEWFHSLAAGGELWVVEHERVVGVLGLWTNDPARGWIGVHPGCNGRGIGSELIRLAEERARRHRATRLQLGAFAENGAAVQLLERAGYRDARHFFRMVTELSQRPGDPSWPDGVTCETLDLADVRAFYEANNEAFEDEDFSPLPFEVWKPMRVESPDFDPTLWFLARDGQDIAGVCRCERERWGCSWIAALGVRKPWRRRGLGRALLQQAFREFYERGGRRVGLGVVTQNANAIRLYESAGMRVVAEEISFEKELV